MWTCRLRLRSTSRSFRCSPVCTSVVGDGFPAVIVIIIIVIITIIIIIIIIIIVIVCVVFVVAVFVVVVAVYGVIISFCFCARGSVGTACNRW